jgi:hypothetical protein
MTRPTKAAAVVSLTLAAVVGFVWLNYGWILWNMPTWNHRLEAVALRILGDEFDRQSRALSGSAATDCGRVGIRGNPAPASECALKAFQAGKPFRVRYNLQGIDSNVSAGLVYTPEGKLYGLSFDGDPHGQGGTSWSRQRSEKSLCPVPDQLYLNPNGRLNCFSKRSVPPHDIMSPNLESY